MQRPIPRRVIQFFIGTNFRSTLRTRAVMSNLRLLNGDFEYLFFDNTQVQEFVEREFPQYRAIFDSFKFTIQKCDFFRYLVIYRLGGFYFDTDVLLASGLSDLLEHGCVFPFEQLSLSHYLRHNLRMDWQIGNYGFGAAPGHPFLEAIIENCLRGQKDPNWVKPMMRGSPPLLKDDYYVQNSTGPGLVSRTLAERSKLANSVTVLFPDDVCNVDNWYRFGDWGVHLMDSSWRPNTGFIRRKLNDYYSRWTKRRLVKQGRRLGKLRDYPCINPRVCHETG